ncbi:MAG: hypothetical protein ABIH83_00130 [Candidatus Micrarchaeota archaeon]
MGNVMIALDDEAEKLLRSLSLEKYGGKKGSIRLTVKEALLLLKKEKRKEKSMGRFRRFIERRRKKGIASGYKMYKSRSEIYD